MKMAPIDIIVKKMIDEETNPDVKKGMQQIYDMYQVSGYFSWDDVEENESDDSI
jgi:hypothetical protein